MQRKRRFLSLSQQHVKVAYVLPLALSACATNPAPYPAVADVQAVTEAKPRPTPDILTDPAASDRYNAALEAWGERLHSAGLRLCRYFERTGMRGVEC